MNDTNKNDLMNYISGGETETVEFKKSFNDEALETIGAFSNARGGIIFVGVDDLGNVCGFQEEKKSIEDIANRIQAVTDPRIQPSISIIKYKERSILRVEVAINSELTNLNILISEGGMRGRGKTSRLSSVN